MDTLYFGVSSDRQTTETPQPAIARQDSIAVWLPDDHLNEDRRRLR